MRIATSVLLIAAAALIAASCGIPITAGADYRRNAEFGPYTTFAWEEGNDRPVGDPRFEDNPFFVERLHAAIERELGERGIRYSESEPALLVHHHLSVRDRVEVYEADRERGYETPEYGPGTQVIQYEEGTLLVDIADSETKEIVWRGWARGDIGPALEDAGEMEDRLTEAVSRMFDEFPVAGRTSGR